MLGKIRYSCFVKTDYIVCDLYLWKPGSYCQYQNTECKMKITMQISGRKRIKGEEVIKSAHGSTIIFCIIRKRSDHHEMSTEREGLFLGASYSAVMLR